MQSTDIPLIKAALRDHAFLGSPLVCCPMGRVVAVRERKGQLLAMIRGWGVRWYAVPSITIEEKLTTRRSRWRNEIHIQHQIFAQNILKRDHTLQQEKVVNDLPRGSGPQTWICPRDAQRGCSKLAA